MKKKTLFFLIIFIIAVLSVGGYIYYDKYIKRDKSEGKEVIKEEKVIPEPEPEPEVQVFRGKDRPIAVMIDNEPGAWPQAGLQDAYMIYEVIVEGGQSRLMALFKGTSTEKVGPIRSSRHYFVEFAMEHSAIYAHFGWSPKAQETISNNSVNNINGMYHDGGKFWREGYGYHTSFTSIANLQQIAKDSGYLTIGSEESIYNYSAKEYNLESKRDVTSINMTYSSYHSVYYQYDETKKVFLRSQRGKPHTDRVTKNQYFAKNIIVLVMSNYTLSDGTNKGRQEVVNEGTGTGYYFTNGKCVDVTWKKDGLNSKTVIADLSGNEIVLNDGITFVQIVPKGQKIDISYKESVVENENNSNTISE